MMDAWLRAVCLWIAVFAGTVALACLFFPPVRLILVPATAFVAGTAVVLFLRILFSPACRRGINAINEDMQGSGSGRGRPIRFRDPDWGLFGRRAGTAALLGVRAVLFLGMMPLALLQHWVGMDVVKLWVAGTFVAMELSIIYAALSRPAA
ncbi:hypothetical protein [Asticcacaulis solisilvae]|uniref:hypothetical protein n=1 Tax=Asticcacaulis solisilvae TaxID=1217274 RepID=UPI003FD86F99